MYSEKKKEYYVSLFYFIFCFRYDFITTVIKDKNKENII